MKFFTFITLVFVTVGLFYDYKRDQGHHKKAKLFHSVCITLICVTYANTAGAILNFFRNIDGKYQKFSTAVGIVPGSMHFVIYLCHLMLAGAVFISAIQMINRNQKARMRLLYCLPFLALIESFSFYRGWLSGGEETEINDALILLMGLFLYSIPTIGIVSIYNSLFMKSFFEPLITQVNLSHPNDSILASEPG